MNMHHITKSLFVGAAIAGIGMSSGRADVPLSGETRIWNLVVKDIEPLYKKKGIKLNADGLRHAITQTVLNRRPRFYEKDMYGEYDSFRSFVLHVKHAMFGVYTDSEQSCKTEMNKVALSEVMRFANGDCEKRGDIERTCPKLNFFAVARSIDDLRKYFCCNEDFPYRKVTLEQAEFIDKHFMLDSIRNGATRTILFESQISKKTKNSS